MTVIKCKMCGGNIVRSANNAYGICDSCGSTMTLPKIDDEQRSAAFNRGNHFRRVGEFDKALTVYESIVREDDSDAEAHWCCALCRFGIEYVEDPATYEWLPTCHRASFDSFLEDVDYLAALEHSDGITRRQYQKDGTKIAEVQRGILATSQNEEPFDVFICYKESDENGQRTRDSLLAQEIYYQLTEQGRRVFFARITLEDKAGTEYEPYIFAALNSAKVMVAVGTKPEHFNAVWVKNEWSRFLALMRKDRSKLLLPCYRDMDPYDLPEQLSVLQSYDIAKIGFIQDLTRGISKVLDAEKAPQVTSVSKETVVVQHEATGNADALLKRGYIALEDGEWTTADEFFEQVLNQNAECAEAYLGKALAAHKCRGAEELGNAFIELVKIQPSKEVQAVLPDKQHIEAMVGKYAVPYYQPEENVRKMYDYPVNVRSEVDARTAENESIRNAYNKDKNLTRAIQYASAGFKKKMDGLRGQLEQSLSQRVADAKNDELARIREIRDAYQAFLVQSDAKAEEQYRKALDAREFDYQEAVDRLNNAKSVYDYINAKKLFDQDKLKAYKDCVDLAKRCDEEATELKYQSVLKQLEIANTVNEYQAVKKTLETEFAGYKDSKDKIECCDACIVKIEMAEKAAAQRKRRITGIAAAVAVAMIAIVVVIVHVVIPYIKYNDKYNEAIALMEAGEYHEACWLFAASNGYRDADAQIDALRPKLAVRETVSAGHYHTVGLKSDGTVVAVGNNDSGQCDVANWSDIISVSAGGDHTIGLKSDGTVVAVGYNHYGQCDVANWTDIISVSAGERHTVGLKSDGTVVAVGYNDSGQCDVANWSDIISVSAGSDYTIGLKSDGTVVAVGDNDFGQCDVANWTDIISVSAGSDHTIGLKSDGAVVAVGWNGFDQCEVANWTDIISVSAGDSHTVGLKSDGTVVAVGWNDLDPCDVANWTDIISASAGAMHTIGLKLDGTVVAVGWNDLDQCNVGDWSNIRIP